MATAEINAGICGFVTIVRAAAKDRRMVQLSIESACKDITRLAEVLHEVDAYKEISSRRGMTQILDAGVRYCAHAACPVPSGIVKAMEVAAGLALPRDVTMRISAD